MIYLFILLIENHLFSPEFRSFLIEPEIHHLTTFNMHKLKELRHYFSS